MLLSVFTPISFELKKYNKIKYLLIYYIESIQEKILILTKYFYYIEYG